MANAIHLDGLAAALDEDLTLDQRKNIARAALGLDDDDVPSRSAAQRLKLAGHRFFCVGCYKSFKELKQLRSHVKKRKAHMASLRKVKAAYEAAKRARDEAQHAFDEAEDAHEADAIEAAASKLEEAEEVLRDALLDRTILERLF